MKTVRFASLVQQSGHPEVYLLLTDPRHDQDFQRALKARRVLSVHRDKTDFATPGYTAGPQSQVLVFPKPLKIPDEVRVVGIHYDLLKEAPLEKAGPTPKKKHAAKLHPKEAPTLPAKPAIAKKPPADKVISFPKPAKEETEEEPESVTELKAGIRKALKALEDGKQVAAFNLLQRLVD